MEGRLTNMELLFTHLERQVAELNAVVLNQQRQIELIEKQVRRLRAGMAGAGDAPDETLGEDTP